MRIVDFNQRTVAEQMSSVVGALNAVAADLEGLRVALNDQVRCFQVAYVRAISVEYKD